MEEKEEGKVYLNGRYYTKYELEELHRTYVARLGDHKNPIKEDLRGYCQVDEPFGFISDIAELTRRATLKDVFQYIDDMSSSK